MQYSAKKNNSVNIHMLQFMTSCAVIKGLLCSGVCLCVSQRGLTNLHKAVRAICSNSGGGGVSL